ncbi:MAG: hypothetical protein QN170_00940, partial [Armatimonadota bacterium]|nr:hypothetical protein [Armatimonadota bacterium]
NAAMSEAYRRIDNRLKAGEVVILDGGIGSELQEVGYPEQKADRPKNFTWGSLAIHEAPDKLIEVRVDLGREVRTIVTGLVPHYQPDDLVGKTIVVVANLQPRRVRGVESRGMLLAAEWDGQLALVTLDRDLPPGARVS